MMKYPIGIQSFEQIIKDGYVYVDKTALIYDLVTRGKIYFLSRGELFSGEEGAVRGAGHQFAGEGVAGISGVSH